MIPEMQTAKKYIGIGMYMYIYITLLHFLTQCPAGFDLYCYERSQLTSYIGCRKNIYGSHLHRVGSSHELNRLRMFEYGSANAALEHIDAHLAANIPSVSANPTQAILNSLLASTSNTSSPLPSVPLSSSSSSPTRRNTLTYANPPQRPSRAMSTAHATIA